LESLIELDKAFFVFLNSLGYESFDFIWLLITDKKSSIPLYIFLLFYSYKKLSTKDFLKYLLVVTLLILFTDQISGFFKDYFQRLRPCHDPDINSYIRIVKKGCGGLYSFFSSHAANTFALATFFYILLKKYSYIFKFLFAWALIVSYSRIYVGVHFPMDILFGICFGVFSGYMFSLIASKKYYNNVK
jgi:undecaprenyl-diphosphatase